MHPRHVSTRKLPWFARFGKQVTLILLAGLTFLSVFVVSTHLVSAAPQQLSSQGKAFYEAGQFSEAAEVWQQAAAAYAQVGDRPNRNQNLMNAAEALQALGLYPRACNTLLQALEVTEFNCQTLIQVDKNTQQRNTSLIETLTAKPDSLTHAIGIRSLGDTLQRLDQLNLSQQVLQLSLAMAQRLSSNPEMSAALLSLGNVERAFGNRSRTQSENWQEQPLSLQCLYQPSRGAAAKFYQQAADFYQQAATQSTSSTTWVQAQLNHFSMLLETNNLAGALKLLPDIQAKLADLPNDRTKIYAQINLAQNLSCLKQTTVNEPASWRNIAQALATTVQQARSMGDRRAESYALGYLGGVYALNQTKPSAQDLAYAQDLTQQALVLAQTIRASDIAYQWQWQLGHLLGMQGDAKAAIAAYTDAFNTLQSLRNDLAGTSLNVQFAFQEKSVEPVYRQLVDLLLQAEPSQQDLKQALSVIEALQLAELENLLRCSLQVTELSASGQAIDPTAAIVYPILLHDRLEIILSLPNQPLHHYSTQLPNDQSIDDLLATLREILQKSNQGGPSFLKLAQQVYGWLIQPLEMELEKHGIQTLVFVLDGTLRNIPMAALHDGQRYLIEKYALAVSPSLKLLKPQPASGGRLEVLAAGIFQNIPGFSAPALPEVKDELEQIAELPKSLVLRNQEFTRQALGKKINARPFSVVHLATHGQFSSQPDQTFIRAWDDRVNIDELKNLLQSREQSRPDTIELLVLSACETATGDKRAALGLAGVAVRAGARSTLATLWQVNDNSTAELMTQFYRALVNPGDRSMTKAKALQQAQIEILQKYPAPFYWAPYVLVGNWL
jgi:CHAT domain-containing protein